MPFSGFTDLDPRFAGPLQQMLAAQPGISVGSGYRTPERQAMLFRNAVAKYGSEAAARHWVAPPGHSRHNMRLAADLQFANDAAR
jgi:LAS superfamily LD-carboxypeptidase LdcB